MMQKDIFRESEGDAWFIRNREKLGQGRDLVSDLILANGIVPKRVVEIGCSNGWRLAALRERYGCEVFGVDPSMKAAVDAAALRVPVACSTASTPAVQTRPFDMVIYGFCLYLTDPQDWFQIVAAGDAMLEPGGHLIIHDFDSSGAFYARQYEHRDGVLAYHFDFAVLWMKHPLYTMVSRNIGENAEGMVTILKKLPVNSIKVYP